MNKFFTLIILISAPVFCVSLMSSDDFIFKDVHQKIAKKKINDVKLTDVLESPQLYKNSPIRFYCKFIQSGKLSRVVHTKYNLSEFMNFSVWPDEIKLWNSDELKVFAPLVFIKKLAPKATVVGKLKKYQRVILTGRVTNDYKNTPWIEIHDVKLVNEKPINDESLFHIRLGAKYQFGDDPKTKDLTGINYADAEIEYSKALEYALPENEESAVLRLKGHVQILQSNNEGAILTLEESLSINEDSAEGNFLMAQAKFNVGEFEESYEYAHKALDIHPKQQDILLFNARVLIELKKFELAKHHCISALRLKKSSIEAYSNLGLIYDVKGEFDVSREMYRRAIQLPEGVDNFYLHKKMAHALLKMALVEEKSKDKEKALAEAHREFDASINEINDKDPESFYLWGLVLKEYLNFPDHFTESVKRFSTAIKLKPDYYEAYMEKGDVLYHKMNKAKEAIVSYQKASMIKPKELKPLQSLERIYRFLKDYDNTIATNLKIVALSKENFYSLNWLGLDYHQQKKNDLKASEWFGKAVAVNSDDGNVQYYYGKTLFLSKQFVKAVKPLELASVALPKNKDVFYYKGKNFTAINRNQPAINSYEVYLSLDPSNIEIRIALIREYWVSSKKLEKTLAHAKEANKLSIKDKKYLGESLDAIGWTLALMLKYQEALKPLESAVEESKDPWIRYHLAYVYNELFIFEEGKREIGELLKVTGDDKLSQKVEQLHKRLLKNEQKETDRKRKEVAAALKKAESKKKQEKKDEPKKKSEPSQKSKEKAAKKKRREDEKRAAIELKRIEKANKEKKEADREKAIAKKKQDKINKEKAEELAKANAKKEKALAKERRKQEQLAKEAAEKKKKEDDKLALAKAKRDKKLQKEKQEELNRLALEKAKSDEKIKKKKQEDKERLAKEESKKAKALMQKKDEAAKKKAESDKKASLKKAQEKKEQDKLAKEKLKKEKALKRKQDKAAEKKAESDRKKSIEAARLKKEEDEKAIKELEKKKKLAEAAKLKAAKLKAEKLKKDKAREDKRKKEAAALAIKKAKATEKAQKKAKKEEEKRKKEELAKKKKSDKEKAKKEAKAKEIALEKENKRIKLEEEKREEARKASEEKLKSQKLAKAKAEKEAKKKAKKDAKLKAAVAKKAEKAAAKKAKEEEKRRKASSAAILKKKEAEKSEKEVAANDKKAKLKAEKKAKEDAAKKKDKENKAKAKAEKARLKKEKDIADQKKKDEAKAAKAKAKEDAKLEKSKKKALKEAKKEKEKERKMAERAAKERMKLLKEQEELKKKSEE